jgi:hypothetical protein
MPANLFLCILVSGGFKFASTVGEMGEVIDKRIRTLNAIISGKNVTKFVLGIQYFLYYVGFIGRGVQAGCSSNNISRQYVLQ